MNRGLLFLSITFVMLYGGIAHGQELPLQKIVNVKMRAADPRLDTPVTMDADRMYLGEVLEKVSVQTGVSISIPSEDLYSGVSITCHVKNIPLANFMNSIWSLVSFSKAAWQITSDTQHQPPSYQLLTTLSFRALADRLDRETDGLTADLIALLLKIVAMTPKDRQANVHKLSQAMLRDDDALAKTYVEDSSASEHFWSMIGLFATILTPDQQAQVLKEETISVPLNRLDADTQAMLLANTAHFYTEVNGVRIEKEPPDTVRFSSDHAFGKKKHMIKDLCIGVGSGQRFTTGNFLGGIEFGLAGIVYEGWILPGDLRHAEPEKQTVGTLPDLSQDTLWGHVAPLDLLLTQLADAQHVSYLAVAPDDANNQIQVSVGKSAQQCLDDLKHQASLMHKWRDGMLLFNYPVWFYGDDALYPYALIKQLRESKQRNVDRPLTLPDIVNAVITLNDVQMKRLAKEFPQIDNNKTKRPIFVFYRTYPGILSDAGLAVDLVMVAMLKKLNLMPPLTETDSLERMRIVERANPQINDGRRLYLVQIQTARQKDWRQIGDVSILPDRTAPR